MKEPRIIIVNHPASENEEPLIIGEPVKVIINDEKSAQAYDQNETKKIYCLLAGRIKGANHIKPGFIIPIELKGDKRPITKTKYIHALNYLIFKTKKAESLTQLKRNSFIKKLGLKPERMKRILIDKEDALNEKEENKIFNELKKEINAGNIYNLNPDQWKTEKETQKETEKRK